MKIEVGIYRTREGYQAIVLSTNVGSKTYPIIGYVIVSEERKYTAWNVDGTAYHSNPDFEIVEPWDEPKPEYVDVVPELSCDMWSCSYGKAKSIFLDGAASHSLFVGYVWKTALGEKLFGSGVMWRDETGLLYHSALEGRTKEICKAIRFKVTSND